MKRRILGLALAAATGAACSATTPAPSTVEASAPAQRFGAPLSAGAATSAVPIATVLASPDAYAGKRVVVDGKVRAACAHKGCWMELASSTEKGQPGCRVTFKDYGFFVPTDSQGASARAEGVVDVKVVPAPEVAHLEGEGASFAARLPDGTAREVRLVATGVEMRR